MVVTVNNRQPVRLEAISLMCLTVCVLSLLLVRLEAYPAPWFDEGLVLQAAKNLAFRGEYGLCSVEGCVPFHPAIQTGPTVILPMALMFRIAGAGILQGRLVIVLYTVLALALFYVLVQKICGRRVAFLAVLLLIFTFDHEFTSFVAMARQVLGEVPALAFFWLGTMLWFRAWNDGRRSALLWPGLLWGLTLLTKTQFVLILPPALLAFWLFDWFSLRRLRIKHFLVPMLISGLCVGAWYGYQAFSLGLADFWDQSMALGSAGGLHLFHFDPRRMMTALSQLVGSSLVLFGLPGMLYAVVSGLQSRKEHEHQQVFLIVFGLVWLGWYAALSIGWMRYAFVPAVIGSIFSARLLGDLWDWAGQRVQISMGRLHLAPGQMAIAGIVVVLLLSGLIPMTRQIARSPDSGLQELGQYLNTQVPIDEVIESWEWEVDVLTDHAYHHPSYDVLNVFTERLYYGVPVPPGTYDPLSYDPAYLIVGTFAKWTGVYDRDLLAQNCTPVESFGEYDLYRVSDKVTEDDNTGD